MEPPNISTEIPIRSDYCGGGTGEIAIRRSDDGAIRVSLSANWTAAQWTDIEKFARQSGVATSKVVATLLRMFIDKRVSALELD